MTQALRLPTISFKSARHEVARLLVAHASGEYRSLYHSRKAIRLARDGMEEYYRDLAAGKPELDFMDFSLAYLALPCAILAMEAGWPIAPDREPG